MPRLKTVWSHVPRHLRIGLTVLLGLTLTAGYELSFQPKARAAGIFVVTNVNDSGPGSLRQAMLDANANSGVDVINFNIGSGLQTITPSAALPVISDPVIIDAATQPGYSGVPLIELNGSAIPSLPNQSVFNIASGGTTIRAFVINHFSDGGIFIHTAGGNLIEGNYIGTDAAGSTSTNSRGNGIGIQTPNNIIGGTAPQSRNVISGTGSYSISIFGAGNGTQVLGNYLGTNAAGTAGLGNLAGIFLGTSNNTIGGTTSGARNVIAAGDYAGIVMQVNGTSGNVIQGNYVGTDASGMNSLGIINHGIVIFGSGSNNLIGGTTPGARNVISGNGIGVRIDGSNDSPSGNVIQGNYIGVAADGITPLPNRQWGVSLAGAFNTTVGGDVPGAANVIAFNGPAAEPGNGRGVQLFSGTGNSIRGNSIFSNGRLGIDLDADEVTANDSGDADNGANKRQNFPVISSVTTNASQTVIAGTLNSTANTTFTIDFYANSSCDQSGFGEGARQIGSTTVTTNANGDVSFSAPFAAAPNQVITATATDPSGNTSEFSQCGGSPGVGSVSFTSTAVTVSESVGVAGIPLSRTGGSAGSLSVNYKVSALSATPGIDFIASEGTITFTDGEVSKTVNVPIVDDNVYENIAETVRIVLTPSGNPDTLGVQNVATLTINDDDPIPTGTIGDFSAQEGNSGTTNFIFPITLSNPSSRDITIFVGTADRTARVGSDYQALATDNVVIPAGQISTTVTVQVIGDTTGEGDEIFFVNVFAGAGNANFSDFQGQGTILNDDGAPTTMAVFGRVTEFAGASVPNATITLTIDRMGVIETQMTQTASDGTYTFASFACGNNVTVSASLLGRQFNPRSISFVNTCSDQLADFRLVPLIVISQLYTAGGDAGATYQNDYIEVFNRGTAPVNLSAYSVQYAAANGTSWQTTSLTGFTLQPGQRLLIREGTTGEGSPLPTPDRIGVLQLSSTGGKVALVASTGALPAGPCPVSPFLVDFIGYGTADCYEGAAPAPAPTITTADRRAGDGCVDTDNNGADFSLGVPNPRNRFSPLNNCNSVFQFSSASYSANEGDSFVTITVNRTGDTAGTGTVEFASSNGTASQIRDYQVATGTLSFAAGETSKTFRVLIVNDAYPESSETVNLTLSNPTNGVFATPSTATLTIADNDSAGTTSPVSRQFVSNLVGADEVPANGNSVKGNGGIFQLSTDETSAKVSLIFSGLTGSETGAHVHMGAPGVNGPIIFPLPLGNPRNDDVVNPTPQQVIDLRAGQFYMNVHSSSFPDGEIRGQLRWNPAEEADFFVRQAYFDFLSRVPDSGGFAFWQNEITQCQSNVQCLRNKRVDVSNAFFYEQEFQQTAAYVLRLYRVAYGNNQPFPNPNPNPGFPNEEKKLPSYAVFVSDRARVIGGANLAQKQIDLGNLFVSRLEFVTKYPLSLATADQFVDAVLATILNDLGVNLSSQRTNLINLYNAQSSQNASRGAVLYRLADDNASNPIANQPLIDAEYNRTFVLGQYFGYLRRNPDITGFLFWLGQVNGAPLRDVPRQHAMVCSFITSTEYQFRFGPVASRNNNECPQ